MTPGVLLAVVVLAWVLLLGGLWRLVGSMDRVERLIAPLNAQDPGRGRRRG
jgi:hypothetical protein